MAAPVPGLAPHHHPPAARHDQPHPRLHQPARLRRRGGLPLPGRPPGSPSQPAFAAALEANPSARFTTAQLVSYVTGLPLGPAGYSYTNTDYILAQMIIEKVTH